LLDACQVARILGSGLRAPTATNNTEELHAMRTLYGSLSLAAVGCLCAAAAVAQTKFTATVTCAKPDPQHVLAVGDRPEHNLTVFQQKCVWTRPIEIGADKYKDGVSTSTAEISHGKMHARGFHVATLQSGDTATAWIQQSQTLLKDGGFADSKGTWGYTSGTGKLKGIKGKGTFSCTPAADGGASCEVEGDYELPK
jgi:hypothetical protein